MKRKVKFIGSAIGNCGRISGCESAPYEIVNYVNKQLNQLFVAEIVNYAGESHDVQEQQNFFVTIANKVKDTLDDNEFPILLGGDHSCAIGSWSGVASKLQEENKNLSLIWIDAHMDAHRPDTSDSGNLHGMPVAHLLGSGYQEFTSILTKTPKLKPENIVYFGIRSFEKPEEDYLKNLGVKIYYQHMLNDDNFQELFLTEYKRLSECGKVGISLDLDGLDPKNIAAVGTPESFGIDSQIFLEVMQKIDLDKLVAFEIAEYNPKLDKNNETMNYILELIKSLIKK